MSPRVKQLAWWDTGRWWRCWELTREIWVRRPVPYPQSSASSDSSRSTAARDAPGRCSGKQSSTELLLVTSTTDTTVGTDPKESTGWVSSAPRGSLMFSDPQQNLARGLGHHFQVGYVDQQGPPCAITCIPAHIAPWPRLAGRCWSPPVPAMKRMEGSGRAAYSIIPSQKIAKRKCTSRKVGAVTDLFAGIA